MKRDIKKPFALATVTFNRLDMVKASLTSWLDTIDEQLYTLTIVDNGSTDGTAEWVGGFASKAPHVSAIFA